MISCNQLIILAAWSLCVYVVSDRIDDDAPRKAAFVIEEHRAREALVGELTTIMTKERRARDSLRENCQKAAANGPRVADKKQ